MLQNLNTKIEEIDEKRLKTEADQKKLIETTSKFNEKIRTFVENKGLEKNAYNDGIVKIKDINQRIHSCNMGINKIKDKLHFINSRLENKQQNISSSEGN